MLRSRFPWRVVVVLAILAASICLWWSWSLTPLQRWYFWPYLNCALQGDDQGFYSEIHWLYKTAPRRKEELATGQDVVPSARKRGDSLPVDLSPIARKEGWTGLVRAPEEWIEIRRLQPFLRREFYGDQSLWKMLLTPLLWSIAAQLCLLAVEELLRGRSRGQPMYIWTTRPESRPEPLARCAEAMRSVRSVLVRITRVSARMRKRIPALRSPAAAISESHTPSSSGVSPFGAVPRTPIEILVWKPTERDRLL